ncbi:MAG: hypothetical protein ACI94Y_002824 [Maribacter sp.]|jgi:hypothetical protein
MKQTYNYKFNPPEPSDEHIRSHMDFDALLKQVEHPEMKGVVVIPPSKQAKRVFLRPSYIGAAVAATLVGVVFFSQFYTGSSNNTYNTLANNYFNQQPYINPPYEQIQPKFVAHNMNADKGGFIRMNGLSNINVPSSAFLDENGNPVSGNVNIKYRNLDDASEYFMSGIPMQYDSLGKKYDFKTTQLFEIYAEKDGKQLKMNPEKGMQISFFGKEMAIADAKSAGSLGVYQLMNNDKNWSYRGQSKSVFTSVNQPKDISALKTQVNREHSAAIEALRQAKQSKLAEIQAQYTTTALPQKPIKFDPNKITFDLNFNFEPSDGNAQYKGLKWQPKGDEKALKMVAATEWFEDEITLRKVSNNLYKLHFDKGDVHVELEAIPVLSGAEFHSAISDYKVTVAEINANKNSSTANNATAIQALEAQLVLDIAAVENDLIEKLNALNTPQNNATQLVERTVKHVFTINQLGIWNCDKIVPSSTIKAKVSFVDAAGKTLGNTTLFLADMSRNSLSKYYLGEYAEINIDPKSTNQIWIINDAGKIAVAYPTDLKKLNFKNGKISITLKTIDQLVKSKKDVYKILKLGTPM